jgi:hypothetical protein
MGEGPSSSSKIGVQYAFVFFQILAWGFSLWLMKLLERHENIS